jgi:hypothetical protein
MADTNREMNRGAMHRWMCRARFLLTAVALSCTGALLAASSAGAQSAVGSTTELGIDAGATFGLGSQSSIDIQVPGSRFRIGFFNPNSRISIEPAAGLGYSKVEGEDGVFLYDLELGLLYHLRPLSISTTGSGRTRVTAPYVRPFIGVVGYSAGDDASDSEVTAGAGLGIKLPWRTDLAWRLEANLGYGFDNKAGRLGLLIGLSYFPR